MLVPRYPFLSNISYDSHLLVNKIFSATSQMPNGIGKEIVQTSLYGDLMNVSATVRGTQELKNTIVNTSGATISAINAGSENVVGAINTGSENVAGTINQSTDVLSNRMGDVALSNMFGSLLVSGTIVAASYYVGKKMDTMSNKITVGINKLGSVFSEGLSLVVSQLDIQNKVLTNIQDQLSAIHETLKSPIMTQAQEWKNIGLIRMSSNLLTEAVEAFEKAVELDKTDPISNLMIGKIYLDGVVDEENNLHNPDKARLFFKNAAKYSASMQFNISEMRSIRIESLYLLSVSTLALSSMKRKNGASIEEVETLVNASFEECNQLLKEDAKYKQGQYFLAKLNLIKGNDNEARETIMSLIQEDPSFASTLANDEDFTKYSTAGARIVSSVREYLLPIVKNNFREFLKTINTLKKMGNNLPVEVTDWLKKENLLSEASAMSKFDKVELLQLSSYQEILSKGNYLLNEIIKGSGSDWEKNISEIKKKVLSLLGEIQFELFDKSWIDYDIKSIKQIVSNTPSTFLQIEDYLTAIQLLQAKEQSLNNILIKIQKVQECLNEAIVIKRKNFNTSGRLKDASSGLGNGCLAGSLTLIVAVILFAVFMSNDLFVLGLITFFGGIGLSVFAFSNSTASSIETQTQERESLYEEYLISNLKQLKCSKDFMDRMMSKVIIS